MSAFVVSAKCMRFTVRSMKPRGASDEALDRLGRDLYALNIDAVRQNRPEAVSAEEEAELMAYRYYPCYPSVMQRLKSLQCLLYQCSEGDVVNHPLYLRMCERERALMLQIITRLPEYDLADWD